MSTGGDDEDVIMKAEGLVQVVFRLAPRSNDVVLQVRPTVLFVRMLQRCSSQTGLPENSFDLHWREARVMPSDWPEKLGMKIGRTYELQMRARARIVVPQQPRVSPVRPVHRPVGNSNILVPATPLFLPARTPTPVVTPLAQDVPDPNEPDSEEDCPELRDSQRVRVVIFDYATLSQAHQMVEYRIQSTHPLGQVFESFLRGLRVRGVYRFLHRGVRLKDRQTPADCGMRAGGTYRIDAMVEPTGGGGGGGVSR